MHRTIVALLLLGAGIISLGMVSGTPVGFAIYLAVLGLAQLAVAGYDLLSKRGANRYVPTVGLLAITTLLLPIITANPTGFLPAGIESGFGILAAGISMYANRRPTTRVSTARYLLAAAITAGVVGFAATPALAATNAGHYAHEHGMNMDHMGMVMDKNMHM